MSSVATNCSTGLSCFSSSGPWQSALLVLAQSSKVPGNNVNRTFFEVSFWNLGLRQPAQYPQDWSKRFFEKDRIRTVKRQNPSWYKILSIMGYHEELVFHLSTSPTSTTPMLVAKNFWEGLSTPRNWSNGTLMDLYMDLFYLATYNRIYHHLSTTLGAPPPRWWKRPYGQGKGHRAVAVHWRQPQCTVVVPMVSTNGIYHTIILIQKQTLWF